jgi:hypothetical protein
VDGPRGLVYHAGGLGDFALSLAAVFRVLQAYPGHTWSLWGDPDRRTLLPGFHPAPPELAHHGHTLWGTNPSPKALAALRGFRVIMAFGGEMPPAWAVPPGPRLIQVASFPPVGGPWVPVHQARQLNAQGVPPLQGPWLRGWRQTVLPPHRPNEIVLHPGSGDVKKNAPTALWLDALAALRRETGLPVRVVLGPVERERGGWQELAPHVDEISLCGPLEELVQTLARARLFLGNDSGASHLAGILGVPSVVLFGPSDPRLWRPLGACVRVLHTVWPCAPCTIGKPITACAGGTCWAGISPREVVRQGLALCFAPAACSPPADEVDDPRERI